MTNMLRNKKVQIVAVLALGIFLGILWRYLFIFPFPQLHDWKFRLEKKRLAESEPVLPGRWRKIGNPNEDEGSLTKEQLKMIKQLQSIGYLAGSQPVPQNSGVTTYDHQKAWNGWNLVTSGHAPEAFLMDMNGNEIHKWHCAMNRAFPEFKPDGPSPRYTYWRRSHLMENGDLLAIFEGVGIFKLDRESNLIWGVANGAHHDLYIAENGNIYTLTRKSHINPKYNKEKPILEDYITILDPDGNLLKEISVLTTLEKTNFAPILNRLEEWGDITHTNTIELLEKDGPLPIFKKGRIILSMLSLDLISIYDPDQGTVWAESDLWSAQHQPTLLKNGHILMLDNKGLKTKSRIIEFDAMTRKIYWVYGGVDEEPFFTPTCGSCQRLPNGNTLITESDPGRAFEVTSQKSIVWEYVNPYRAGKQNELIATLCEVVRLPPNFPVAWSTQ